MQMTTKLVVLDEIQNCQTELISGVEYECRRNIAHVRMSSAFLCLSDD
jgi:hypothetical protein